MIGSTLTHRPWTLARTGDVSKRVSESIRMGTAEWETLVPRHVCEQIKSLKLLGYRELPYSEHPPLLPPAAAPQVGTLQGASTQSQRLKIFGNLQCSTP